MSRRPTFSIRPIIGAALMLLAVGPAVGLQWSSTSVEAASNAFNACSGANSATNSVIHLYLALDQRQFASAYKCLASAQRSQTPFKPWKHGFAHTIASHLVLADDGVPNGQPATQVRIDLHAINRVQGKMSLTSYQGTWGANQAHQLISPNISVAYKRSIKHIPPASPKVVFKLQKLRIMKHIKFDLTGDGSKDNIYVTTSNSCHRGCHAQELWIYSSGLLIYQQHVDDLQFVPWRDHVAMQIRTDTPGSAGFDTSHPTERTYVTWFWTRYGFVFRSRKIISV